MCNKVIIIDYGMGNLRSVQKAFERINVSSTISTDANDIINAQKIVLPGVGNFEKGIKNLKEKGLIDALNEAVIKRSVPVLGICLGMQLMTDFSEEGNVNGLGWIKAETIKFDFKANELKIPHMGWNNIKILNEDGLFKEINEDHFFYFVHSYYVTCKNNEDILSTTEYGDSFVSAFKKNNIYGCQFHPEKSHDAGINVIKNFASL